MTGKLLIPTPHLTTLDEHAAIHQTYLGMAHIAGTGPEGRTCRECVFWRGERKIRDRSGKVIDTVVGYAYFSKGHPDAGTLKRQLCRRPMTGKPKRGVPHDAMCCRLFVEDPQPPAERNGND